MQFVNPVPKPHFPKHVKGGEFSDEVKMEIWTRAKGLCEGKNCPNREGDFRGLHFCHRYRKGSPNRGMGGTKRAPTAEDGWLGCDICHDIEDHHSRDYSKRQTS